jgi:hypothetical protein
MKQPIVDEFTNLQISKQRRWQLRQEKAGKCITCGKLAVKYMRCDVHALALVVRTREQRRGRPGPRNLTVPSYSFALNE